MLELENIPDNFNGVDDIGIGLYVGVRVDEGGGVCSGLVCGMCIGR